MTKVFIFSDDRELIAQIQSLGEYEVVISTPEMNESPSKPDGLDSAIDLIVIDLSFPSNVFDSIDVYYRRSVIVVGTLDQQAEIAEYLAQGAGDYFIKPIDTKLLQHCLQRTIRENTLYLDIGEFRSKALTPLTPIRGYSDLLGRVDELDKTDIKKISFNIWQNGERLVYILHDFFDTFYDSLNSQPKDHHFNFSPCNIYDLLESMQRALYFSAGIKKTYIPDRITVTTHTPDTLPQVYVDSSVISGTLSHLITHALFEGDEYLHVEIEAYKSGDQEEKYVFLALRLSNRVIVMDEQFKGKYGGYFYTHRAVEANGGKLWYENRDDKTIFYLALPAYKP